MTTEHSPKSHKFSANAVSWFVIAIAALAVALTIVVSREADPDSSADDLRGNSFAFGILHPDSIGPIKFAGSPTLDLAPTPDGTLYGQARIPFASVPDLSTTGKPEPVFLFALPREAQIDITPFSKATYNEGGGLEGRWWRCDSEDDVFSGDLAALGKYYADLVRVDCTFDGIALLAMFPPGGLEARANGTERVGALTSVRWALTVDFRVKDYEGISERRGDAANYLINLDPNVLSRGEDRPAYASLPNGLRPVLAVTPWSRDVALAPSAAGDLQLPHYGGFGAGIATLTEVKSADRPKYLTGQVSEREPGFIEDLKGSVLFVFLLGLLAGQAQPAVHWLVRKTTSLPD